ncbi:hypothetical protein CA54_20280 [Symmachiella macrocystis]|uniref:Uncharacterized protein n=2 Tax=Symmachiella macrocystis TaxID=2527985 RepID=A0A5C6BPJ6_9PLAN|nr:hypothetical protein CA54_20280 [Symmachiella macrocystis]
MSMTRLTADNTSEFLKRFNTFYDGIVRSLQLDFANDPAGVMTVKIEVRDNQRDFNDGWVSVVSLQIKKIKESCIRSPGESYLSLDDGLHLSWHDEVAWIEVGWLVDPPQNLEELRTSYVYAVASHIWWRAEPHNIRQ